MKRLFKIFTVLIMILGISFMLTAFSWDDKPEDIILVGDMPTEFTVMQNNDPLYIDVSDKGYYLKSTKTGETADILTIFVPKQLELGTYKINIYPRILNYLEFISPINYEATVTVVPFDPKLTISSPKVIKPDKLWPSGSASTNDLKKHKIYAYDAVGNQIDGTCNKNLKAYWGYNKVNTIFTPNNPNYDETPFSFVVFNKLSVKIFTNPNYITIAYNHKSSTLQARLNGGKWRSIKETNNLKLKSNTKYKVEIRQKAESFHKAIILQTSYVKTKKSY